jgi:Ca-activated chloride channel homolog
MKFLYPQFLWLLLLVPVLIAAYVVLLRRQRKHVIRYAGFSAIK